MEPAFTWLYNYSIVFVYEKILKFLTFLGISSDILCLIPIDF